MICLLFISSFSYINGGENSGDIFSMLLYCPICDKDDSKKKTIHFDIFDLETFEKAVNQYKGKKIPLSLELRYFDVKDCEKYILLLKELDSSNIVELIITSPKYALTKSDVCWLLELKNLKKLGLQVKNGDKMADLYIPFLFDNLGKLSKLTHLYFTFGEEPFSSNTNNTKEADLSFLNNISKHPSLEWIAMTGISFPADKKWDFPKKIRMVFISGSILTRKELGIISKSKSITHLSIVNNKFNLSPKDTEVLLSLPNVRCLEVHNIEYDKNNGRGASYNLLRNLDKFPALEWLAIDVGEDGISLLNDEINNRRNAHFRFLLLCETKSATLDELIKTIHSKGGDFYIEYYDEKETLHSKVK
jgi:hypothetical protein